MIKSQLVTNAFIPLEFIPALGVELAPGQQATAAVLKVERERGDWIYVCLSGGYVTNFSDVPGDVLIEFDLDKTPLYMTPMGEATMRAGMALLTSNRHMVLYFVECNVPDERLKAKILQTIEQIEAHWLLVVVGDIAGRCNGRILRHLNTVGHIEIERPRDAR